MRAIGQLPEDSSFSEGAYRNSNLTMTFNEFSYRSGWHLHIGRVMLRKVSIIDHRSYAAPLNVRFWSNSTNSSFGS